MTHAQQKDGILPESLSHSGLGVDCFFSAEGRLERKIERRNGESKEFRYAFDRKGHLTKVLGNGQIEEEYRYNQAGQRIWQRRQDQGFCGGAGPVIRFLGTRHEMDFCSLPRKLSLL